jgi:transketolase C-terminal domain/subunit
MSRNKDIFLLYGDLGYPMFNAHIEDFPGRTMNCGAAEQSMLDISVGLSYAGNVPVCYSITPFLLWRAAETIRTYINHEQLCVKLVGSGRGEDYTRHDGFSHDAKDDREFIGMFKNISASWPETKEDIPNVMNEMFKTSKPFYLNLSR